VLARKREPFLTDTSCSEDLSIFVELAEGGVDCCQGIRVEVIPANKVAEIQKR
jgi:hypothetical protein